MVINHLLSLSWDDPPKAPLNSRPSPRKGRPSNSGWWTFTSSCRRWANPESCFSPSFPVGFLWPTKQTQVIRKGLQALSTLFFLVKFQFISADMPLTNINNINLILICFDHQPFVAPSISMLTSSEQQKPKSPNSPLSFQWPRTVKSSGKHVWTHSHGSRVPTIVINRVMAPL